jgi:hypothetical protein
MKGKVECYDGGRGVYLRELIKETKIVILLGLLRPTVEAHLVDNHLYHGKVVIATHSEGL